MSLHSEGLVFSACTLSKRVLKEVNGGVETGQWKRTEGYNNYILG